MRRLRVRWSRSAHGAPRQQPRQQRSRRAAPSWRLSRLVAPARRFGEAQPRDPRLPGAGRCPRVFSPHLLMGPLRLPDRVSASMKSLKRSQAGPMRCRAEKQPACGEGRGRWIRGQPSPGQGPAMTRRPMYRGTRRRRWQRRRQRRRFRWSKRARALAVPRGWRRGQGTVGDAASGSGHSVLR